MADEVIPNDLEVADELIAERRHEKPGQTPEFIMATAITGAIDLLNDWEENFCLDDTTYWCCGD